MTEQEWLECAILKPMAEFLQLPLLNERKRWLFACACCRRIWSLMPDERSRRVIELRERHVDGFVTDDEIWQGMKAANQARNDAREPFRSLSDFDERGPECAPAWAAAAASTNWATAVRFVLNAISCVEPEKRKIAHQNEEAALCRLLRDIFGNPFRPVRFDSRWRTSTVLDLARTIYDDRVTDRMPILADALMDAGCDSEEIIAHCRQSGEHVRGCWAVDLLLQKT